MEALHNVTGSQVTNDDRQILPQVANDDQQILPQTKVTERLAANVGCLCAFLRVLPWTSSVLCH